MDQQVSYQGKYDDRYRLEFEYLCVPTVIAIKVSNKLYLSFATLTHL